MSMQSASNWLESFSSHALSFQGENSSRQCVTISVTGGKGGVGKTSISLKMARHLAHYGYRVLLIDCDFNMSNTAIKLGLPLKDCFSSLIKAEKNFADCLYKDKNFNLLSACNGSLDIFESKLAFEQVIIDIIRSHEKEYDFVILDCPAGMSKTSLTLNAYCDYRFMVITPDKSSITDSYSLIKILKKKYGVNINSLIINKYRHIRQYHRVVKTMSETVENFLQGRTHVLAGIPYVNMKNEEFDTFFLSQGSDEKLGNFLKAIESFADEEFANRKRFLKKESLRLVTEQDVRQHRLSKESSHVINQQ